MRGFFDFVLSRLEREQPLSRHVAFLKDRYGNFFSMILGQNESIRILSEVEKFLSDDITDQRVLLDGVEMLDRTLYKVCVDAFEQKNGTSTFFSLHKEFIKGIYVDSGLLGKSLILCFFYVNFLKESEEKARLIKIEFSSYGMEADIDSHLEIVARFDTELDLTHIYLVVHLAGEYQYDPNLKMEIFTIDLDRIDSTAGLFSSTDSYSYRVERDHHDY